MLYPNASLRVALIALVPTVLMGVPTNSPRAAGLDPFFSEYVEGSGNNKALEIYNPGMDAIDLAGFTVALYANGKTNPSTYSLTGLLAPGDVFVLGSSRGASAIQDVADQTWGSLNFNGDDAIALTRNGALLDVIGTIGADPGDFWGSASINTKDYTLVRMASVTQGDSDGSNPFDPALQWLAHGPDTFSGLGSHSINSVPIPASLPLLLSGLGIFWGARRRTPASAHIIQSA